MEDWKKKVVLVTGASSGIGRATVVELARRGARVVASGRRREELERTVAAAEGDVITFVADVTKEADVRALVGFTTERFGRLDGAVNAAGALFAGAPTHELEQSDFEAWLNGHLTSAFLSNKHELRAMLASGGGSIVNVGTFVGTTKTFPGMAGYAAAKTGLVGLTRTIAIEYAKANIRANLLVVGGVETPMYRTVNDTEEKRQAVAGLHALGRVARASEIAATAAYLLSDDASFVTGTQLSVEGGLSLV